MKMFFCWRFQRPPTAAPGAGRGSAVQVDLPEPSIQAGTVARSRRQTDAGEMNLMIFLGLIAFDRVLMVFTEDRRKKTLVLGWTWFLLTAVAF